MKLFKPSFEIIEQAPGLDGMYKQIELAGRTCYKSEDKITEDSAKGFVDRMIKSGHGAMLEHGTVYLMIPCIYNDNIDDFIEDCVGNYWVNKYSKCTSVWKNEDIKDTYVTTNLRVLVENNWLNDLQYICEPTEYHEKRVCVRYTSDIHFYKDCTRHRVFSWAIESTRQRRLK